MREFKNKKHLTGVQHGVNGESSFAVELEFLPDYLTASFQVSKGLEVVPVPRGLEGKAVAADSLYWELVASPTGYTFTVYYSCVYPRDVKWIAAKLPKNAEILAH